MTEQLAIDCAWTKPDPAATKADGYSGVIGYVSTDPTKDLSAAQAQAYIAAGLWVLFVWETTATRALDGSQAGIADAMQANAILDQRGYPADCPILVAVDTDATWAQVDPYFQGFIISSKREVLPYGGIKVVEGFFSVYQRDGWQTAAWSGGAVSLDAALYQRLAHTRPPIAGVDPSAYDEDVVIQPLQEWGGSTAPTTKEADVALETLVPGAQPLDIPAADPNAEEVYLIAFDAKVDGLPTVKLNVAGHKSDGSDGWVQLPVTQGANDGTPLEYDATGCVTVTKGWPVQVHKGAGIDETSLSVPAGQPFSLQVRI